MKFTMIGGGNTGQAASAYLASLGGDCTIYTRDPDKASQINETGMSATGAVTGTWPVKATTDLAQAVDGADLILVMTTADAHRAVGEALKDVLAPSQTILVFNSNWGAMELRQVLGGDIAAKQLTIAETGSQLFLSTASTPGQVHIGLKEQITISATDPAQTEEVITAFADYFPQFVPARSIIETTMSTTNPVIHVPISFLNLVRIENAQPFLFYGEGVSPGAVELILAIDRERIAVASALGYEINDVLTGINSFWEKKHDNLFDALTKNESYIKGFGPRTTRHRYFTEDIPYGITPISRIGKLFDVPTPNTDALLDLLRKAVGEDVVEGGISFSKADFVH